MKYESLFFQNRLPSHFALPKAMIWPHDLTTARLYVKSLKKIVEVMKPTSLHERSYDMIVYSSTKSQVQYKRYPLKGTNSLQLSYAASNTSSTTSAWNETLINKGKGTNCVVQGARRRKVSSWNPAFDGLTAYLTQAILQALEQTQQMILHTS